MPPRPRPKISLPLVSNLSPSTRSSEPLDRMQQECQFTNNDVAHGCTSFYTSLLPSTHHLVGSNRPDDFFQPWSQASISSMERYAFDYSNNGAFHSFPGPYESNIRHAPAVNGSFVASYQTYAPLLSAPPQPDYTTSVPSSQSQMHPSWDRHPLSIHIYDPVPVGALPIMPTLSPADFSSYPLDSAPPNEGNRARQTNQPSSSSREPNINNQPPSPEVSDFIDQSFPPFITEHSQQRAALLKVMESEWKKRNAFEPDGETLLQFMRYDSTQKKWLCTFWKKGKRCTCSCKKKDHARGHIRAHIGHQPYACDGNWYASKTRCLKATLTPLVSPNGAGACNKRYPAKEPLKKHCKGGVKCSKWSVRESIA